MKPFCHAAWAVILCLSAAIGTWGETQQSAATLPADTSPSVTGSAAASGRQASVPRLMKFSGTLRDAAGKPLTGAVDVTFSLYSTESGGDALWFETQGVQADELGRYTALLGAMHADGLPTELFTSGEVRWLGIQVGHEPEQQPRVLLVSVPYALKAGDAETLGGKPASAYVLSDAVKGTASAATSTSALGGTTAKGSPAVNLTSPHAVNTALTACASVTSDGTAVVNYIPLFTTACNIQNSILYQVNGRIGMGTTTPQAVFHMYGPASHDADAQYTMISTDTTSAAQGVGGGITFAGFYDGTTSKAGFANIRGVKENGVQGDYASALIFDTRASGGNQTERMRITSAGRVGIGITAPGATLQVVGVDSTDGDARFNMLSSDNTPVAQGVGGGITFTGFYNSTNRASFANIRGVKENATVGNYASALIFDTRINGGSQTERMRISSTGNVGIGTSAPAHSLDVVGDINATGNITAGGVFTGDGSGLAALNAGNLSSGTVPDAQLGGTYSNALTFQNASNVYFGDGSNLSGLGDITAVTAGEGLTGGGTSGQVGLNIDPTVIPELSNINTFTNTQNVNTGAGTALVAATNDANTAAAVFSNADAGGDVIEVLPPGGITAPASRSISGPHKPGGPIMRVTAALDVMTAGNFQGANLNADVNNTLVGVSAGNPTMTGINNTALGHNAFSSNTSGGYNEASGESALHFNTSGSYNTAVGGFSLYNNTSAGSNVGLGYYALLGSTDAGGNTAVGYAALANNCSGVPTGCTAAFNTAVGDSAGLGNSVGYNNTFVGYNSNSGATVHNAAAIGENAVVSQSNAMALGGTGADAVNVGIGTATPAVTLQVVGDIRVGTSGTNGCVQNFAGSPLSGSCSSDARLKTDIQPFSSVLDKVAQLQPVHYHWRVSEHPEYHFGTALITGLIAQDVEKVFPDMVAEDSRGFKTVNYAELPFLLLESVRELKAENDSLRAQMKSQGELARSQKDDEVAKLRQEVEELRALVLKSGAEDKSAVAQAGR